MGKKIFGDNITLWDDVYHPLQIGAPWDGEGLPRQKVLLVDRGVPKNLVYSRATAKKMKTKPTGHGFTLPNEFGEAPMNLVFSGGDKSVDDMIRSTERGILVTRLWYIREVDPYEKVLTGMTRDGTFLDRKWPRRRRHSQFPLQSKRDRSASQRRDARPSRARRRRRIIRNGSPGHEDQQFPFQRSNKILKSQRENSFGETCACANDRERAIAAKAGTSFREKKRIVLLRELQAGNRAGNYVFLNLHQISIRKRHPENRVHLCAARNVNHNS